jgi:hypothetical protein
LRRPVESIERGLLGVEADVNRAGAPARETAGDRLDDVIRLVTLPAAIAIAADNVGCVPPQPVSSGDRIP